MLRTIQMLEAINKRTIDMKSYAEFLTERKANISIRNLNGEINEDLENNFRSTITEGFLRFNKMVAYGSKLKKIDDYNEILLQMPKDARDMVFYTSQMVSLVEFWNCYKQVYKFDQDTFEMISNLDDKLNLTLGFLKKLKLPYEVFFIENSFKFSVSNIETILIGRTINTHNDNLQLMIMMFKEVEDDNGEKCVTYCPITLVGRDDQTIKEVLETEGVTNGEYVDSIVNSVVNLLMYLSQPKVEILKKLPNNRNQKNALPKNFYSVEPTENEVGYHLGNAIRKYKYVYELREKKEYQGGTKRPHMRQGHFHHYWAGKGRTQLIVKFVEPTFVLGGSKDVEVHNVKSNTPNDAKRVNKSKRGEKI